MNFLKAIRTLTMSLLIPAIGFCVSAQENLPKVIKIVVPYSAGGATDLLARYFADQLGQNLKRTVVVENRPGASGQIGAKVVSDSNPNASVLLLHTAAWPASKVIFKSPLVDVPSGLEPISQLADEVYVLTASMDAPFKNFHEFVNYAKQNPGKLNYASGGLGDSYLIFESYLNENKIDLVRVEYKGAAPALAALFGNEVQLGYQPMTLAQRYEASGKLKILAVSGNTRQSTMPNVPTFEEVGVKNARHRWYALYAPPKTPNTLLNQLTEEIGIIMSKPETRVKLSELSMEPRASSQEQLRQLVVDSLEEFRSMAKAINFEPM